MDGTVIDFVKYIKGYSRLGEQTIQVALYALPTNMTVVKTDEQKPLFSIPWANLGDMQIGYVEKRGVEAGSAFLFRSIPVIGMLSAFDAQYDGIWVSFWDEQIQRSQAVYFATRSDHHASELIQNIYQYRDAYYRTIGKAAKPTTR